jgi:hypothetical protein
MENIIENLIIGIVASGFVTLWWVIFFKPRFNIENEGIKNGKFRVKLINKQFYFSAINIKIEVCTINKDEITKHFDIDKEEHLLLKRGKFRIFKATVPLEYEQNLKDNKVDIRVQVYAAHSFSGFGKEYERIYRYDSKTEKYLLIKKHCCPLKKRTIKN